MKMLFHSLGLDFPSHDARSKDARIISEKMDQLNQTVEQILSFARHAEPKLSRIDVNQLIRNLTLLIRHKLRNQGIALIQDFDPNIPQIDADGTQLEQAFLNLALNAVQAMPTGGELASITRQCQQTDQSINANSSQAITIVFKDTGEGMSPAQCSRAFTSLLSSSKRYGTGLGLTIVRKIVETHQGRIQIQSEPGKGTIICINLPILSHCPS
jgi:signal transduction histidine kinase